jgi:hypothetical protein
MDGKLVRALIQLPVAVTGECEIEDYHIHLLSVICNADKVWAYRLVRP